MRNDIDSMQEKMNCLLEAMVIMAINESNSEITTNDKNIIAHIGYSSLNIPGVTNPEFGFPIGYVHQEGVVLLPSVVVPVVNLGAQNHYVAFSRH